MKKTLLLSLSMSLFLPAVSTYVAAEKISAKAGSEQRMQAAFDAAMQLKQQGKKAQAEMAFAEIVKNDPQNIAALEQLAIMQSWQNKFDSAIENFKKALDIHPDFTSARIGLARVSYWQGERKFALNEMEKVLKVQSDVPENWILKGDILMADGQVAQARVAYLKAKQLKGSNSDQALNKKIEQAKAPNKWRLDAGYIADSYTAHRVDGHSSYLQLGYTFENKTTLYVRGEEYLSFDRTDTGFVVGAYALPHSSILLNAEYYQNNGEAFSRPNDQFSFNADLLFNDTWQPLLGYRLANYDVAGGGEGEVETLMPGLRLNIDNLSLEYRHARSNNVDDTTTATNTLKVNIANETFSPYVFFTNGEEGIPPEDVADISIIGGGAVIKLSDDLGFRVDVSREDRKDTYIHTAFGAGISLFF